MLQPEEFRPRLLIISDTPMWCVEGKVSVFEPTLREVEFFSPIFNHITWIGFEWKGLPPSNSRMDSTGKISFVLLPRAAGGEELFSKLKILPHFPKVLRTILRYSHKADVIHTRGPSLPAFIGILQSYFTTVKIYWHKYAGNWGQKKPPLAYKWQIRLLRNLKKHVVTVNGFWPDLPQHILSFENPCFTNEELMSARIAASEKKYTDKLIFLFVGRMEYEKGAKQIIDALLLIEDPQNSIAELIFVGHGKDYESLVRHSSRLKVNITFQGMVNRENLNEIYKKAHLFLLPTTASEGFPKVIAEASAFGCVPVVSDISSIGDYVKDSTNGYLLKKNTPEELASVLKKLIIDRVELSSVAGRTGDLPSKFTYERYNNRIRNEIITR